jgi:hypothetical protein
MKLKKKKLTKKIKVDWVVGRWNWKKKFNYKRTQKNKQSQPS